MNSLKTLIPLSILCAVLIGHSYIDSAWTDPAAGSIASTNTPAPVNVGIDPQSKTGPLGLESLVVFGDVEVDGILTASTSVRSRQYCDENGANCFTPNVIAATALPTCSNGQTLVADATGTWICGVTTTPPTVSWLVNSQHSESQCTALNGIVSADSSGNKYCRFTASACPSGWAKYQNWAAYRSTTSTCGYSTCTSPARAWSNTAGAPSTSLSCRGINGSDSWTPSSCSSAMNEVGCY